MELSHPLIDLERVGYHGKPLAWQQGFEMGVNAVIHQLICRQLNVNFESHVVEGSVVFKHIKSGGIYRVLAVGNTIVDRPGYEPTVAYVSEETGVLYMRSLNEFNQKFERVTYAASQGPKGGL